MKRIKFIILVCCLGLAGILQAQEQFRHEFSLGGGLGLSTLQYKPSVGDKALFGFGGNVALGYTFFFSPQWGLGTGVELAFYNSKTDGDFSTRYAVNNTSGLPGNFYLLADSKGYEETQNSMFVNIPLMLQFQTKGKHKFYAALGGKLGIPVSATYDITGGDLTTKGYSEFTGNYYENMPSHNFGEYKAANSSGDLDFDLAFMASAEAGVKWYIANHWAIYTGLYFDYGFNDIRSNEANVNLIADNSSTTNPYAYNTLVQSKENGSEIIDKISPLALGLKVKVSLGTGRDLTKPKGAKEEKPAKVEEVVVVEKVVVVEEVKQPSANEEAARKAAADKAAADKAAAEKAAADKVAADKAANDKKDADLKILTKPVDTYQIGVVKLNNSQEQLLDQKVDVLKRNPEWNTHIEGYTCDIANMEINTVVAQGRANNAKAYMVSKGIAASRITTEGKPKCCYVVENSSDENRLKNRRIEVKVK